MPRTHANFGLNRALRAASLWLCVFVSAASAADARLEVYDTWWPPTRLAPHIEPLLKTGETITVFNDKLIVRASPARHAEISELLARIDIAPRTLRIQFRESVQASGAGSRVTVYRGSSIDDAPVTIDQVASSRVSTGDDRIVREVRVVEGEEARVDMRSVVEQNGVVATPLGVATETRSTSTGTAFFIRPTRVKEGVRLEISSTRRKTTGPDQQAVTDIDTVVTVPLDLWTPLAGSAHDEDAEARVYSTRLRSAQEVGWDVRVSVAQ